MKNTVVEKTDSMANTSQARALRARWDRYKEECFKNGKKCAKCLQVKSLSQFVPDPKRTTGVRGTCRKCANERWNKWNALHPEWKRQRYFRAQQSVKDAAYNAYGGYVCACCGETDPIFLTIDHVNNDGNVHRKEIGSRVIYYWLKEHAYPSGFQILCWNCNRAKHYNDGVCPHQLKLVMLIAV